MQTGEPPYFFFNSFFFQLKTSFTILPKNKHKLNESSYKIKKKKKKKKDNDNDNNEKYMTFLYILQQR